MEFIKLTSIVNNKPVFINPATIGHIYEVAEKVRYTQVEKVAHTVVGTTCHNNGGFQVTETAKQIFAKIQNLTTS
tara:strand:- start:1675 stop:1899 length:225 start_codon:yes stop_codon:yes gene_type:complete